MGKTVNFVVSRGIVGFGTYSETASKFIAKKIGVALILGAFCFLAVPLFAQYQETTVDESLAVRKASVLASGNQDDIRNFAKNYYLARWTLHDNLRQLHSFRREMGTDVAALPAANKKICLDILIEELAGMASNESLFPATRYNAALAVGMFNEREAGNGGSGDLGAPYAPALPTMLSLWSPDGKETGEIPDYIVLAVLIGLDRYAALGIPDAENKKATIGVFIKVLEPSFGKERNFSSDVVNWMQLKAVEGLSAFGSPSDGGEGTVVLDTLIRLLKDKTVDYMVQGTALRGIGQMNFDGLENYDFEPLVTTMARYAVMMSQKEVIFIEEENIRTQVETTTGTGIRSGTGMTGGDVNTETVMARIKFDLESLRIGISGVNDRAGVLARLTKEEQAPLKAGLESMMEEIDRSNGFLDFGEMALEKNFDPKKMKRSNRKNTEQSYMVNSIMMKDFVADQAEVYQEIVDNVMPEEVSEAPAAQ